MKRIASFFAVAALAMCAWAADTAPAATDSSLDLLKKQLLSLSLLTGNVLQAPADTDSMRDLQYKMTQALSDLAANGVIAARDSSVAYDSGKLSHDATGLYRGNGSVSGGVQVAGQRYRYLWSEQDERILSLPKGLGAIQLDEEWGAVYRVTTSNHVWIGTTGRSEEFAQPNRETNTPVRIFQTRMPDGHLRYQFFTRTYQTNAIEWSDDPRISWNVGLDVKAAPQDQWQQILADLDQGRVLWATYNSNPTNHMQIFYSSDGGAHWGNDYGTWTNGVSLIKTIDKTAGGPLYHYHGAWYDKEYSTLYVFQGDNATLGENGLLICRDVWGTNGLISNPNLWRGRWALETVVKLTTTSAIGTSWRVGDVVADNNTHSEWSGFVRMVDSANKYVWVGLDFPGVYASVVTASGVTNHTRGVVDTLAAKSAQSRASWSRMAFCAGYFAADNQGRRADSTAMRILHVHALNDKQLYWLTDDSTALEVGDPTGTKLCSISRETGGNFRHLGSYPGLSYGGATFGGDVAIMGTSSYASGGNYGFSGTKTVRLIAVESGGRNYEIASMDRFDNTFPNQEITLEPYDVGGRLVVFDGGTTLSCKTNWAGDPTRLSITTVGRIVPNSVWKNILPTVVAPTQMWEGGDCAAGVTPAGAQVQGTYGSGGLLVGHRQADNIQEVKDGRNAWKLVPDGVAGNANLNFSLAVESVNGAATKGQIVTASCWVWLPEIVSPDTPPQQANLALYGNSGGTDWLASSIYTFPNWMWNGRWNHVMVQTYRTKNASGSLRVDVNAAVSGSGTPANYVPIWIADLSLVNGGVEISDR